MKVAFFSRGRGHGHAIDDISLAESLSGMFNELQIEFVSYATGARTFIKAGRKVRDMQMPENNSYVETLDKSYFLIRKINPDIVLVHEEFAAVPAAGLLGVPTIFISAWLPPEGVLQESLRSADSILVLGEPGIFPIPLKSRADIRFSGNFVRKLLHTRDDRLSLRRKKRIDPEAYVIAVMPGGWASEGRAPIADIVLPAFQKLEMQKKRLFWISSQDCDVLRRRSAGIAGVKILDFVHPVSEVLAMCDVIITKGTRGASMEAASLGIPSISISHGGNPVDEILVPRIQTNIALMAKGTSPEILNFYLKRLRQNRIRQHIPEYLGSQRAGAILAQEIRRLTTKSVK